jgi:hypothetical protein
LTLDQFAPLQQPQQLLATGDAQTPLLWAGFQCLPIELARPLSLKLLLQGLRFMITVQFDPGTHSQIFEFFKDQTMAL